MASSLVEQALQSTTQRAPNSSRILLPQEEPPTIVFKPGEVPYKMLDDKVLIQPDRAPDRVGNILLPEVARRPPNHGLVLAVGPGRTMLASDGVNMIGRLPSQVKVGDRVMFQEFMSTCVEYKKVKLLIVVEVNILCVEESKEELG